MLNSWPKFLVVVLVACLQCVAPLIHAHTSGVPGHHDTHTHGEETSAAASVQALDVDHHHGQSIGVAKEYKRDYTLLFFDAAVSAVYTPLPQTVSLAPDLLRSFAASYTRFARPAAQAP
jgi:hypothetical protein